MDLLHTKSTQNFPAEDKQSKGFLKEELKSRGSTQLTFINAWANTCWLLLHADKCSLLKTGRRENVCSILQWGWILTRKEISTLLLGIPQSFCFCWCFNRQLWHTQDKQNSVQKPKPSQRSWNCRVADPWDKDIPGVNKLIGLVLCCWRNCSR